MDIAAAMKLSEALRPQSAGEQVNVHVVRHAKIRDVDFEAMRKLVAGTDDERTEISEKQRTAEPIAAFLGGAER